VTAHDARPQDIRTALVSRRSHSAGRLAIDVRAETPKPAAIIGDYTAIENDFRSHHETNAARRRGPYEHYRLVYRYGYDLGIDPRYCDAAWADVEQAARPCWEERNPGTWASFQETIRYAWDQARRRGSAPF
jgi:hypothetical protein